MGPIRRLVLKPEMTIAEVLRRWPHTRLNVQSGRWTIDPEKDGHLTLREYAQSVDDGFRHDFTFCWLNNCAVLFDATEAEYAGDADLIYYERFRGHRLDQSPEQGRPTHPVYLAPDGLGLVCDGGLPHQRWVLSEGLNAVRLQQEGPMIEMLTAFQRTAGMSSERIFDGGFLDARVGDGRHAFDQVHLTHYGYENHLKADPSERSGLLMHRDRLWFELHAPGRPVAWVLDDTKLRPWQYHGTRQLTRHGWDPAEACVLFQVVDVRRDQRQERPKDYEGFSDEDVRDYIGTEWEEVASGRTEKTITCWVAVGGDQHTTYAVAPAPADSLPPPGPPGLPVTDPSPAMLHTFAATGSARLYLGIGSTRQGALAELGAAREGSGLHARTQARRYAEVGRRRPVLRVAGHPVLGEVADLIPVFMESLKTGFALMRSRPHDGAVCGGWDQLMISSPMVRMGDREMVPRFLEHWLHQFQFDGQVFHVSDFDLSPALIFERWDLDDFMYLIVAAQWISHAGDEAMLERLAPRITHTLRVMLRCAHPELGLIPCRGIFPDWPPLDTGRKGITYPAMETGLWYEALRWWEGLCLRLGEEVLSARLRETAEKIRAAYPRLFWDAEVGALCDAVFPETLEPLRSYTSYALTAFQGCFGHELLAGREYALADHVLKHQVDLSFPGIRGAADDGAYPSAYERLHWPLLDHLVAKTMRRGSHREGLAAVLEVIERQYQWFHCAREMIDMWRDQTQERISEANNWFGWSSTGWYEALLCGAAGIWEEPGGLAYIPADQHEEVALTNLPYRAGTWDILITGSGPWVQRFAVDGQELAGVCKIPARFLTPGTHRLDIERCQTPPSHPFVLDSVGLQLGESAWKEGELHLSLAGPGRALVRFYCPRQPYLRDAGKVVSCIWDHGTGIGWVEVARGTKTQEISIS